LVRDEIAALAQFSSAEYALGAGSWRARQWLGQPSTLADGAPADLVVFDADPRLDLNVLRAPRFVILRGALVN
jgi:imidazolonepropionase-like amidohydrolase